MAKSIYDKTVKELFKEFIDSFIPSHRMGFHKKNKEKLLSGGFFYKKEVLNWFKTNYPKIKPGTIGCHLVLLSTNAPSRVHYNLRPNGADDLLFQMDSYRFRLYVMESDPSPIYKDTDKSVDEIIDHEIVNEKDFHWKELLSIQIQLPIDEQHHLIYEDDISQSMEQFLLFWE